MISACSDKDFDDVYAVINDGAIAYKNVIPADRWHEPYMTRKELAQQIDDGVMFWKYTSDGLTAGVMGTQPKTDVCLIRHAYVRTAYRRRGIGGLLIQYLSAATTQPLLVGTWADACWAIEFYERHGFRLLPSDVSGDLLVKYWNIPARQIETSVVLADSRWITQAKDGSIG